MYGYSILYNILHILYIYVIYYEYYIYIYIYIYIFHGYCIYLSGSSKKGFLYNVKKLLYILYIHRYTKTHTHIHIKIFFFHVQHGKNIYRLFDVLAQFLFTASSQVKEN